MSLAPETLIARGVETVLTTALSGDEILVERERDGPLIAGQIPCVQIFSLDQSVEAAFVGGKDVVAVRVHVECIADRGSLAETSEVAARDSVEDAQRLVERCRVALLTDRTLGGAALGIELAVGETGRVEVDTSVTTARADSLVVTAYYLR